MNQVFLYFASGESLYGGAVLLLLTIAVSLYVRQGWPKHVRNLAAWVSLALIVMASPPFSWGVDAIFLVSFLWWFSVWNFGRGSKGAKSRPLSTALLLVVLLPITGVELSHRRMPTIVGSPSDHLVVIGDSISSGIDPLVPAWPVAFQQMTGIPTKNLSVPGTQAAEARKMAEKVTSGDRVVLVEIGGNDLLGGESIAAFHNDLEAALSKLAIPGRVVIMFELPLLPNKVAFEKFKGISRRGTVSGSFRSDTSPQFLQDQTQPLTDCIFPSPAYTAWRF